MKNFFTGIALLIMIILLAVFLAGCTVEQEFQPRAEAVYPSTRSYVVDEADVLSEEKEKELFEKLKNFDATAQIAVVTVKTTAPLDEKEYAVNLAQKWGIGDKEEDNGVLFLIVTDDRKLRIEVGQGLEDDITDGRAGMILDRHVVPELKNNNWEAGITKGVDAIIEEVR